MKRIQPDLWETETENPSPGLTTHAYLFVRDGGNVLFYNTGHRHELDRMAELGGVAYQYLSHQDELGDTLVTLYGRHGTKLGGHVREQAAFARFRAPDILFEQRERHLDCIDIIPTPGHTPGSTCFLVQSPHGRRYLFTGDTLYLGENGEWKAGFIPGYTRPEDVPVMAASLALLGTLQPDVVLSSAFAGETGFQEMRPDEWPARVVRAREELLRRQG